MPNPYLQDQANNIATNLTQNWQQNALPSINGGAMMAGGFGGSRQGVAQALSANGLNQAIGQAQTGLYSNAYNTDTQAQLARDQMASQQKLAEMQNQTTRDLGFGNLGLGYQQAGNQFTLGLGGLANNAQANQNQFTLGQQQNANQRYGMDQSYNLGLGQLGLGQYNAETNRGLGYGQLSQQGDQNAFNNQLQGYNAQLQALNALQNWNTNGINWANQQQQTPLQNLGLLSNIGSQIGGPGASQTTPGYSALQGALAGGLSLAQLYQLLNKTPGG